jgi:5-methylcytosine-specific restriction endonuclease McrA
VCKEEKSLDDFHKNKNRATGVGTTCKPCAIARTKKWGQDNPERVLENSRKQYHKDIDKSRKNRAARVRKWYAANPEQGRAAVAKWKRENRDLATAHENMRRARKKNAGIYVILPKEIKRILNSSCSNCGTRDKISFDHIIPLARGGRHSIGNLQPMCIPCNSSKNEKTMMEWKLVMKGRD